ncbi:MAG: AGE family epimerase/isomerase, partial [Bacteroidota bacterium]
LTEGILAYWETHALDLERGGFVGQIVHPHHVVPQAHRGGILTARILWTYAAAHEATGQATYRTHADRAYHYLTRPLWDHEFGGVYWMVDADGHPCDTRKHIYAQAFALYGLSAYHQATGHVESLDRARALFELIERYAADAEHGGYAEAFGRHWRPLADARLSVKDQDVAKSMNTHLHLIEAYTALLRVWPDPHLRARLTTLVDDFLAHIVNAETGHLHLFFEADWTPTSATVSYGHDIEASWLLLEADEVLQRADPQLHAAALRLARVTLHRGRDADGALFYETHADGSTDTDRHWWPQAEAVVGFLSAYQQTADPDFLHAALATWRFIRTHLVDPVHGEWFWCVDQDGVTCPGQDKVGPWKGPYHNGRACLEAMRRADLLLALHPLD